MKTLDVEITNVCNEKCRHCYHPEKRDEKFMEDMDLFEKMLGEFGKLGFMYLTLTGGEPLLNLQFKEIFRIAQKQRYAVSIKTNGTLINDDFSEFLKEMKPRNVEVSLYSLDSDEHDNITGFPGSFEKTMEGIKLLRSYGVKVSVFTPVIKGVKKWKGIYNAAKTMDFHWSCSPFVFSSFDERSEVEKCKLNYEEYYQFLEFTDKYESQKINDSDPRCFSQCQAGNEMISVCPDFTVKPCLSWPETTGRYVGGNCEKLLEVSGKTVRERFPLLKCHECEFVKECSPCTANLKIIDNIAECDTNRREYVRAYKDFFN